jgi:hypothetical protein
VKFVATKKGLETNFFSSLSFFEVFGSGIRDPGWVKNQNPGPEIRDKHPGSATLPTTEINNINKIRIGVKIGVPGEVWVGPASRPCPAGLRPAPSPGRPFPVPQSPPGSGTGASGY